MKKIRNFDKKTKYWLCSPVLNPSDNVVIFTNSKKVKKTSIKNLYIFSHVKMRRIIRITIVLISVGMQRNANTYTYFNFFVKYQEKQNLHT